jgi:hypothetical protein
MPILIFIQYLQEAGSATWYTIHLSSTVFNNFFVIHYCCDNTRKVHAPNATHVLSSWKVKIVYENSIFTVEPQ